MCECVCFSLVIKMAWVLLFGHLLQAPYVFLKAIQFTIIAVLGIQGMVERHAIGRDKLWYRRCWSPHKCGPRCARSLHREHLSQFEVAHLGAITLNLLRFITLTQVATCILQVLFQLAL